MRVFVVYWHPEPQSFNAAMFHTACYTLAAAGNEVSTSDLHERRFDPVSSIYSYENGYRFVKTRQFLSREGWLAFHALPNGV